jgi:hypothetical protein
MSTYFNSWDMLRNANLFSLPCRQVGLTSCGTGALTAESISPYAWKLCFSVRMQVQYILQCAVFSAGYVATILPSPIACTQ